MKYRNSIKNIFLPLTISSQKKISNLKELNSINKNNDGQNCHTQKNLNINKNMDYSKYFTSLPKVKSKKYNIPPSLLKTFKNNLDLNYNFTSPYMYRQIITQYKNSQKTFSKRNDNKLDYNNYTDDNLKITFKNNNEEKQRENKFDLKNIPTVRKISLRNILYDKNYHEKQIKNIINDKKENENDDKNDIKNADECDRLSFFTKFRNNNIKKRNAFIKKSETYNKNVNSNDKNIDIKYDKYDFQPLIKSINNDSSYKTYCINKYTPKRKNKNEYILDLLYIKE